jgi:hypothetical protein
VFSSGVRHVLVEIDFANGAEPYTDELEPLGDPFTLTVENLEALFGGSKDLIIPQSLSEMEAIDVPPGPYDGGSLVRLAEAHRDFGAGPDVVSYYAVWLDGFYEKNGKVDEAVLGAALPDYGIVAMFKPAVRNMDHSIVRTLARFTEQSAFVHEMGHVLGLVGTGLPQVTEHEDPDHAGHCDNPDCVMFWANEGPTNLGRFTQQFVASGNDVLFDAACLNDAHAALGR